MFEETIDTINRLEAQLKLAREALETIATAHSSDIPGGRYDRLAQRALDSIDAEANK